MTRYTLDDFDVYPNTGYYKATISNDLDVFKVEVDLDGERNYTRVAIAVNHENVNWGDILSYNYRDAFNRVEAFADGFYVIDPQKDTVEFISGEFNDKLIPYLLELNLVKPSIPQTNEKPDIDFKSIAQPVHKRPNGFLIL
jgi:hypothetical protein